MFSEDGFSKEEKIIFGLQLFFANSSSLAASSFQLQPHKVNTIETIKA
jgi:hypothetical protein